MPLYLRQRRQPQVLPHLPQLAEETADNPHSVAVVVGVAVKVGDESEHPENALNLIRSLSTRDVLLA
jgi:hypothetical protein